MKFKTSLLGVLASAVAFGAAGAADLPNRKEPIYVPAPAFSWTGWHFGVNGGWRGGSVTTSTYVFFPPFAGFPGFAGNLPGSASASGYVIGGQDGYLWQLPNNIVVGYEEDLQYSNVSGVDSISGFGGVRQRLDWFGTERLRFGYAMGRFLPYLTGGLIYGKVRVDGQQVIGGFMVPSTASTSGWRGGWTIGGGLEYAAWNNISVKAEYLYAEMNGAHFGGAGVALLPGAPGGYLSYRSRIFASHIARVGLNYNLPSLGALVGIDGL